MQVITKHRFRSIFTEPYMVKFLLHNTLGAWWAGKVLAAKPDLAREASDEQSLRDACAVGAITWNYLRFVRVGEDDRWHPAAGSFPGWPARAAEITYCDPCCGSGHFLVEAFAILVALRQHEEGLSGEDAAKAVLRDNLHGLELDGRCVQIAAFNVALAAWKCAGAVMLPQPHIAWVGAPPPMSKHEMAALGNGDPALRGALVSLYEQFTQAPVLGSLLDIGARDLLDADLRERGSAALERLRNSDPERAEGAFAAKGLLAATELLGNRYVLVATNVPFLGRGKQCNNLANWIEENQPEGKPDLATAMVLRIQSLLLSAGTFASVMPQGWLTQPAYRDFRHIMRFDVGWGLLARLGEHAFDSPEAAGAFVVLFVAFRRKEESAQPHNFEFLEGSVGRDGDAKARRLIEGTLARCNMQANFRPETDIFEPIHLAGHTQTRVRELATSSHGLGTFDSPRFTQKFWEQGTMRDVWILQQSTPEGTQMYSGCTEVLRWEGGRGSLFAMMEEKRKEGYTSGKWKAGTACWGKRGVLVSLMRGLPATLYLGYAFDPNAAALIPSIEEDCPALWAFCEDGQLHREVRRVHQAIYVPPHTFLEVPIDREYWKGQAAEEFSNGLPEPYSDDPTQWLFHGHPAYADSGTELHVALARIAGYRWPAEIDTAMRLADLAKERVGLAAILPQADRDGLLPLHATSNERPLADRLRAMLSAAYGAPITPAQEAGLIRSADAKLDKKEARDATLEGWLRDRAFRQHCVLFHHRPFLWHVWDGLRDGFSAFLHYHRLDYAAVEKLTFTLLGDWMTKARAESRTAHENRGEQLKQSLRLILEGETPYDIFVRWKSPAQQPIGWHPDLDDGVRLNIRPFMTAGVLREQPKINWNKDRGTDVKSAPWYLLGPQYSGKEGDRINDHHLSLAEKQPSRAHVKAS
jgi:hypothetical protein